MFIVSMNNILSLLGTPCLVLTSARPGSMLCSSLGSSSVPEQVRVLCCNMDDDQLHIYIGY